MEFKVGSHAQQVIDLNKRIKRLTSHLKNYKKDHVTKLSLFKLVAKKKRFLKYLKNNNFEQYKYLVDKSNLKEVGL
ncbi:30S ribosomal protein S15 [Candidatus Mycoplasma haematohominis]|uniref:30S ribosomal protein S15 n=1 Tax=Candidatus Mycoplasma haematohominis TaxID=1494318 RepID=A0A478FQL5_9MOLU|nr:30S ribosomal protein S15 [Candidatus Mycoplasma haemohominis]GCE63224.1 30S ribosomal protein S15 [Candidatus Mycoplasma haemohominis]